MIPDDLIFEVMNEIADLLSKRKRIEVLKDLIENTARFNDHPNRDAWLVMLNKADEKHRISIELVIQKLELSIYAKS